MTEDHAVKGQRMTQRLEALAVLAQRHRGNVPLNFCAARAFVDPEREDVHRAGRPIPFRPRENVCPRVHDLRRGAGQPILLGDVLAYGMSLIAMDAALAPLQVHGFGGETPLDEVGPDATAGAAANLLRAPIEKMGV